MSQRDRISGANVLAADLEEINATPLRLAEKERRLADRCNSVRHSG